MRPQAAISVVLGLVLVACGGGAGDMPERATGSTGAKAAALRARPAAAAGAALSAADQLMNYAEASFPQYFPVPAATQSYPPFQFRFYPATGIYLGVVVSADPAYVLDGVYVMGGAFGTAPAFVGPLTAFITPDSGPAGGNGCYDFTLLGTEGTRIVVSYASSGSSPVSSTRETVVGGLTSFEGHTARELRVTTTETAAEGTATETQRQYGQFTGPAELTDYGLVSTVVAQLMGLTVTIDTRSVWSPPAVDRRAALGVGQSFTLTYAGRTTTTTKGVPGQSEAPETSTDSTSSTITYLGREQLTVPAGRYDTCKFEERYAGSQTNTTTTWVIHGKGIEVKLVDRLDGSVDTTQATSVTLNGQPL